MDGRRPTEKSTNRPTTDAASPRSPFPSPSQTAADAPEGEEAMTEPEPTGEPVSEAVAADPDAADADEPADESADQVEDGSGEAVTEAKKTAAPASPPAAVPEPASPEGADPEALKSIGEGAGEPGSPGGEGDDFGAAQAAEEDAASRIAELQHRLDQTEQQLMAEEQMTQEINQLMANLEQQLKQSQAQKFRLEEQVEEVSRRLEDEIELKEQALADLQNLSHEQQRNAALKAALSAEQGNLQAEKAKIQQEIEEARQEAARSADALARAEEAIRQEETVARLKLEAEHNAKVSRLASEIDRLRDELEQRTNSMGNEMMRWKSQADAAANAVSLAKDEVMERKRELDITKEKMDHLVEKLYIGREKGLELRGAIDFHLERHRTNYQSGRGGDKLPGIRRGGAPALAAAPSGGASKPRAAKGAFGMPAEKTPRRGSMAGGNMFTPAHDLNRPSGGGAAYGARRGRR